MIRIKNQNYTPPRLPAEYEEVEYIESTGTQYINTGYKPNKNTRYEIEVEIDNITTQTDMCLFGSRGNPSWTNQLVLWDNFNDTQARHLINAVFGDGINTGPIYITSRRNIFRYNGTNVYVNDNAVYTISNNITSSTYNLYLFALNQNNNADTRKYKGKLFNFKLEENNVLQRNFIPCYRKSDNVTGLYDLVNNQFYTNQGTGTFLRGAEVYKEYVNLKPKIGNKNVISRYVGENLVYGANLKQKVNYTMLYDYGDECEELTGGWRYYPIADSSYSKHHNFTNYTFTKNADNLYLYGRGQSTSYNDKGSALTTNIIDSSDYNSVFVRSNYSTIGRNCAISARSFQHDDLDIGSEDDENLGDLFRSNTNTTSPTWENHPILFANKTKNNDIFGVTIISGGYAGSVGVYLRAFVLCKPDFWQPLASLAGISASSIADILTNSTTLLNNENAVKYMISHCTGDFMASAVANQTFLTALNNSPYKTIIQGNEHWNKFLSMVA